MSRPSTSGWRSFRFWYGAFDPLHITEQLMTQDQREITERILNHYDEIAYGGYRQFNNDTETLDQQ